MKIHQREREKCKERLMKKKEEVELKKKEEGTKHLNVKKVGGEK